MARAYQNWASGYGLPAVNAVLSKYQICGQVRFLCNRSSGRSLAATAGLGDFENPYQTLAAALGDGELAASSGDAIIVLPGHSELVADATMLDNLDAGVQIIGVGHGGMMPTFRWTATGSQWKLDDANVRVAGLRLRLEGANGVVKAIVSTAADVSIEDCDIEVASGATAKATIAVEIGSAALRNKIRFNNWRGTETHNVTDGLKVVGGTVPSDLLVEGNRMVFSATAGNGLIHITVAAKRCLLIDNIMYNTHTASTATIAVDAVAADGLIVGRGSGTVNDGTASAQGIVLGAGALFRCIEHYSSDEPVKSGVLNPVAVAT